MAAITSVLSKLYFRQVKKTVFEGNQCLSLFPRVSPFYSQAEMMSTFKMNDHVTITHVTKMQRVGQPTHWIIFISLTFILLITPVYVPETTDDQP